MNNMRMSKETFEVLRAAVLPQMLQHPRESYRSDGLTVSDKRWRWDMLWNVEHIEWQRPSAWVCARLYNGEGLNDDHIDTALRAIAREAS